MQPRELLGAGESPCVIQLKGVGPRSPGPVGLITLSLGPRQHPFPLSQTTAVHPWG